MCYESTLWDVLFTIAMLVLLLGMFPYDKTRKMLHYYYRWKLRRAFYYGKKDMVLADTIKKRAGRMVPYFISSVVMNDFVHMKEKPLLVKPDDPQLKQQRAKKRRARRGQPFHLFSLAPKFCGCKRTGYMKTGEVLFYFILSR